MNVSIGDHGTFVINKQSPNKQLWLSSPVSGPSRYDFCLSSWKWVHSRDGTPLLTILADDLDSLVSERLSFDTVSQDLAALKD